MDESAWKAFGEPSVLAHYRGPASEADLEWMRQRAVHVGLGNLAYGRMAKRPPYIRAGLHTLRQVLPPAWEQS